MQSIIEIRQLNKHFGDVWAVRDLNLTVQRGELFAFLGANGAGKSTTINILCGQLSADSGEIHIDGKTLSQDSAYIKQSLGVVFQSSVLDGALSVYDNLVSRAALYGITGQAARERIGELAALLDFSDFVRRPVSKLSGGQRRKIDVNKLQESRMAAAAAAGQGERGKTAPIKVDKSVGRNEPCPCGSGKKYKHCHGKL